MMGPGTNWYVAVAAILFGIGVTGVILRRSPLIVLLSLEIMLNASNLALVGFSRHFGSVDGQIFAICVMAVAAAEVVVGAAVMIEVIVALVTKADGGLADSAEITRSFGSPAEIGRLFLTDHLLAFEITSIVLLVAAVGGVVLALKTQAEDETT